MNECNKCEGTGELCQDCDGAKGCDCEDQDTEVINYTCGECDGTGFTND